MEIKYYERWVRAKKMPVSLLDVAEANHKHDNKEPYVAVISIKSKPQFVIDLAADWVSVYFLDDLMRVYLTYDFKEIKKGALFLSTAIHREYEQGTDKILISTTFTFTPDGSIYIEKRDHESKSFEERESTANPAANWDAFPVFGDYSHLCLVDRSDLASQS